MIDFLIQFFYMLFAVVPYLLLCYVPFSDKLARPMKRIIVEVTLMYAVILVPFCMLFVTNGFDPYGFVNSLLFMFVFCVYFLKTVKDDFQKPLFVFFVVVHIIPVISGFEQQFRLWLAFENYNFRLIDILFRTAFFPLVWLALNRLFSPRLKQINSQNVKGLWVVPVLFFSLAVVLSSSVSYLTGAIRDLFPIVYYSFNIVAFVVYILLIRMFDSTAESAASERINRAKIDFYRQMSHEIRAPLTVIATGIDFADAKIKSGGDTAQIRNALDIVREETQRLGRMVGSMFNLAAMSDTDENRKRVDFAALLINSAEVFRLTLEKQGNSLEINIAPGLPDVYVDADRFAQVLTNLFTNTARPTKNGKTALVAEYNETFITVRLSDTGGGISQDILPHVFERGVTGESGTGYGLYLCKTTVEAHGGAITANSDNGGTTITFTVPVYGGQDAGHE